MKVIDYSAETISGNVWPHSGKRLQGPYDLRVGLRSQPPIVRTWGKREPVLLHIEQPNEEDNFTLIHVMFLKPGAPTPSFVKGLRFRKASHHRNGDKGLVIGIKIRYTNSLPHPVPTGRYPGNLVYDTAGRFAVLTLQAGTLRKAPEPAKPRTIIQPGDPEYYESLENAKRTLS